MTDATSVIMIVGDSGTEVGDETKRALLKVRNEEIGLIVLDMIVFECLYVLDALKIYKEKNLDIADIYRRLEAEYYTPKEIL